MYWFQVNKEFPDRFIYQYFHYVPLGNTLQIRTKIVDNHQEFIEWYELNKSL